MTCMIRLIQLSYSLSIYSVTLICDAIFNSISRSILLILNRVPLLQFIFAIPIFIRSILIAINCSQVFTARIVKHTSIVMSEQLE